MNVCYFQSYLGVWTEDISKKYSGIWKLDLIRINQDEQKAVFNYCDLVPNSEAEAGNLAERKPQNTQGKKIFIIDKPEQVCFQRIELAQWCA